MTDNYSAIGGVVYLLLLLVFIHSKNKHSMCTTRIEPIQNIGTYHRRITSIINISPTIVMDLLDRTENMSAQGFIYCYLKSSHQVVGLVSDFY